MIRLIYLLLLSSLLVACAPKQLEPDADFECDNCVDWNLQQDPFRIYGGSWYVGTAGLSSVLIEAGDELILIDGGLPQSAAVIDANIRSLGFDPTNISTILVSHAHFDHAGGVSALQHFTGATVYSSVEGARALSSGELQPNDPQYFQGTTANFPAISKVVAVDAGDVVTTGGVDIKAIYTPGHTPGGMTWAWESCALDTCYQLVYADSLTAVSAEGYRFSDGLAVDQLNESADAISLLECDILLSPHPFFFGMQDKLENRDDGNPFVNNVACSIYAATALGWLERRLQAERGEL
jgi:metallo-beta-lactamase class B